MEAKAKAEELLNKYMAFSCTGCDIPYCDACTVYYDTTTGKEMAIIAVDEILFTVFTHKNSYDYWKEVKQHLEKL